MESNIVIDFKDLKVNMLINLVSNLKRDDVILYDASNYGGYEYFEFRWVLTYVNDNGQPTSELGDTTKILNFVKDRFYGNSN